MSETIRFSEIHKGETFRRIGGLETDRLVKIDSGSYGPEIVGRVGTSTRGVVAMYRGHENDFFVVNRNP